MGTGPDAELLKLAGQGRLATAGRAVETGASAC